MLPASPYHSTATHNGYGVLRSTTHHITSPHRAPQPHPNPAPSPRLTRAHTSVLLAAAPHRRLPLSW